MTGSITIFTNFTENLDSALQTYITTTATNVTSAIAPVSLTLLSIYVMFWGWSMIRGLISEPVMDGVHRMIRLSVIVTLATKIGFYNDFISSWLWNMPNALAQMVLNGNGQVANISFLDELVSKFSDIAVTVWEKALSTTIPAIGFMIMALLIWVFGFLLTAYAAYLLILSKMALAILLGVGAIFVLLTLFDSTRKFFDAWIGQVLNYIFLTMLTSATISLTMGIIDKYITSMSAADLLTVDVFCLCGLCGMTVLILMQMPSIASTLGGGVAISTLGSFGKGAAMGGKAAQKTWGLGRRGYELGRNRYQAGRKNTVSEVKS